jgi:predicted metal-dependent phosphoesterase TrpH
MITKDIDLIKRINLHLHTNVSDGALSPARLIKRSQEIGLDLISITDHDTADAYRNLPETTHPLRIVPGMEISSQHQGHDVHILAYRCDLRDKRLTEMTECIAGKATRALNESRCLENWYEITLEEVVAVAGSGS